MKLIFLGRKMLIIMGKNPSARSKNGEKRRFITLKRVKVRVRNFSRIYSFCRESDFVYCINALKSTEKCGGAIRGYYGDGVFFIEVVKSGESRINTDVIINNGLGVRCGICAEYLGEHCIKIYDDICNV